MNYDMTSQIAVALPGWEAEETREGQCMLRNTQNADEALFLHSVHGRVTVRGQYPRYRNQVILIRTDPPHISASSHRGAEAIAGDIARRFLPDYRKHLRNVQTKIAMLSRTNKDTAEVIYSIADVLGCGEEKVRWNTGSQSVTDHPTIYLAQGHVEVYCNDSVSIELRGLSNDTAIRIAHIIN